MYLNFDFVVSTFTMNVRRELHFILDGESIVKD